ncbi:MAG: acyl-CoA dehydratase activase [Actinomycetota bacterium]
MKVAGLDIGSRTIALVELAENGDTNSTVLDTSYDPLNQCQSLLKGKHYDCMLATGYGRHLAQANFASDTVTEIKAFAVGASHIYPNCRAVLDIGGQDMKVITLADDGKVKDFDINDRCAAGTGKFLEVMAEALNFSIQELGGEALKAKAPTKINSVCTVFAESEVISLIARGENRRDIAYGIHEAISERIAAMINRMGVSGDLIFAGGVAYNKCIRHILEKKLNLRIYVPDNPQIVGALGAALLAERRAEVATS